ncbi:MAG: hypothetical protein JJ863_28165 [Deltaproteobacteria bacterium]|nr:hypothetical protein [Deltaproteobacteria bacterium]
MDRAWRWMLLWAVMSAGGVVHAQAPESGAELGQPAAPESESGPGDRPSNAEGEPEAESETAPGERPAESESEPGDRPAESQPAAPAEAVPPPPTGGYTAPQGYQAPPGQWEPASDARVRVRPRPRRVSITYREGMTVPAGGSLVSRRRRGFLIPGLIGFAATYAMNLVGSAMDEDNGIIAIPFVGFPIYQIREGDDVERPLVAVHTVVQLAAFALLVVGLIPKRTVEYFTLAGRSKGDGPRWALVPTAHRRGAGLALTVF